MKNKSIIVVAMMFVVLASGLFFFLTKNQAKPQPAQSQDLPTPTPNLSLTNLPQIKITHANKRNYLILDLKVPDTLWQTYPKITYEFMYSSDKGPRGLIGELAPDKTTDEFFLGSESSGKKVYDTGITDGQITLHLEKPSGETLTLGPYDLVIGGFVSLDSWQTETLSLTLAKKTRKPFVLLINSGVGQSISPAPKAIISLYPETIKLDGQVALTLDFTPTKISHDNQDIDFKIKDNQVTFPVSTPGHYLIY
ncbi:MAG: hypothetical protein GXP43_02445 [bacterium]|nr:hypothetical protein [bacterium]